MLLPVGGLTYTAAMAPVDDLEILYRDDRLLAVHKPSGMPTHRGWANDGPTAAGRVRKRVGARVHAAHRLDRGTSGVLLFALDREAAAALGRALQSGRVEKRYVALVRGHPPSPILVDHPLRHGPNQEHVDAVTACTTLWSMDARGEDGWPAHFGAYSVVDARPRHGRRHQIRRHLKHLRCPVVGDTTYGDGRHNRLFRERFHLRRLALHALELVVPHPDDDRPVPIFAPLPSDLADPLEALGLPPAQRPGPALPTR